MKKIQCVSFPRSGHHLLTRCLLQYFEEDFQYCSNVFRKDHFTNPKINFQKNHDFDLNLPQKNNWNFVIQYRHPIESLISWYKWEVKHGIEAENNFGIKPVLNQKLPIWNIYTKRDTLQRWTKFLENRLPFWVKFVHKWIINNRHPETIYISYNRLIKDSNQTIKKVAEVIHPDKPICSTRISDIVTKNDIYSRNPIQNFKYFDEKKFRSIENSLSNEFMLLNIRRLF